MGVLEIKEAVRARDGYRCVHCGMTNEVHIERFKRTLDVHRKDPGSPYCIDGTETVCRMCHPSLPRSPHGTCEHRNVRLPNKHIQQLKTLAKRSRRKISVEVAIAVEEYLARQGLWPAP